MTEKQYEPLDPEQFYEPMDLFRRKALTWLGETASYPTYFRFIVKASEGEYDMAVTVRERPKRKKYLVQGSEVLRYEEKMNQQ